MHVIDKIRDTIERSKRNNSHSLEQQFATYAKESSEPIWQVLKAVFGYHLRSDNPNEPFGPMVVMNGRRSPIPDDLSGNDRELLYDILETVSDPVFACRVADVLWVTGRDVKMARLAINSYLEHAVNLRGTEDHLYAFENLERGFRLARQADSKGLLLPKAERAVSNAIVEHVEAQEHWLAHKLLRLFLQLKTANWEDLSELAESLGDITACDQSGRREHLRLAAIFAKRAKLSERAELLLCKAAKTLVVEAEAAGNEPMVAHSFWEKAIQAYKDRPTLRAELPKLKKKLAATGRQSVKRFATHTHKTDITGLVRATHSEFECLPLDTAITKLALCALPASEEKVVDEAKTRRAEGGFLAGMFASVHYDAEGMVTATVPSAITSEDEGYDSAIAADVQRSMGFTRGINIAARIVPALRAILATHHIDGSELSILVKGTTFFPDDRLPFITDALAKGFDWDFSVAVHLLMPQFEYCLRHLCRTNGVEPREVNVDGSEKAWGLDRLLSEKAVVEAIGVNFAFEVRSLLVEKTGPNLRNSMAHGLLHPNGMGGGDLLYAWWLFLVFTVLFSPMARAYVDSERSASKAL